MGLHRYAALLLLMTASAYAHEVDLTHLPLGDGKISTEPKKGWIWACRIDPNAGGAFRDGPWIKPDGTYDLTAKPTVSGDVHWPSHYIISLEGERRLFTTNDFPNHATGTFPIPPTDEGYQYDRNPNHIAEHNITIDLPADPALAPAPSCAPGAIGILITGAVLFNALDAPGRDAVAHEVQDKCQGHPQESGVYHYHSITTCLDDKREADGSSALVGYAIDGFGIYGRYSEGGKLMTSADLDECHGRVSKVMWDGKPIEMYHYVATWDFPYTIGCMRGRYKLEDVFKIAGPPPRGRPPPQN
jgi:YHYH protein